ncbi:MAG: translation initiation factor IF-2 N-terminal domain-containing protein, partial [Bacteroidales bacterium]|nr:translation initiation factor IF-2 N-terminal domain-containing protein [Bacteroidales bacterium]
MRLSKVAKELNVGISTIVDYLNKKGKKIETSPNTKIESELYEMLLKAFPHDREKKNVSNNMVKVRPV